MNEKIGIWIDHRKAVIVSVSGDRVAEKTLESNVGPHSRYSGRSGIPHDGGRGSPGRRGREEVRGALP